MIKYGVVIAVLAGALALGGCATTGGTGGGVDVLGCGQPANVTDVAKCAQKIAASTCGFVADIGPLVALLSGGQFTDAVTMANAVCAAVTEIPKVEGRRAGAASPVVGGVVITGHFKARR